MILFEGHPVTAVDLLAAYVGVVRRKGLRRDGNPRQRCVQIPGICGAAVALGVSRQHLYEVLKGRRHSPRLARRYRELQRERGAA